MEEPNAASIRRRLQLEPHPVEGGYYRRTYTAAETTETSRGSRALGSAIYYLLEQGTFSEMHRLASDEIFHFYCGDAVEMLQLWPDGSSRLVRMGQQLEADEQVQVLVPAGVWQGTRLLGQGRWALMGCTVCPGFDFADYKGGSADELIAGWPQEAERIRLLTRR